MDTVAALRARIEDDYRRCTGSCRTVGTTACSVLKEPALQTGFDTVITSRATAAVTAAASRPGPAAHTARAWIDSLTVRAQIRLERQARLTRASLPKTR